MWHKILCFIPSLTSNGLLTFHRHEISAPAQVNPTNIFRKTHATLKPHENALTVSKLLIPRIKAFYAAE